MHIADIISLRSSERTATRRSKEQLELETPLAAIADRQHTREEEQKTNYDDLVICCHTTWIRKEQQTNNPYTTFFGSVIPHGACMRRVAPSHQSKRKSKKSALLASCGMEVLFVIFIRRFLCSSRRPAARLKKIKRT
jgi:hypothetical protein